MTARYIPFGRTEVNQVAGAGHYPHEQFWPRQPESTFAWAAYSCLTGAAAGPWLTGHHLLGITVALVTALVRALVVERAITAVRRRLDRRAERREADAASEREPGTAEETQTGPDGHHDHTRGTDNGTEPGEGSVPISERVM